MQPAARQGRRIPNEDPAAANGEEAASRIPHDLDVERALLGAMLVDPRAIDAARAVVSPADFYAPGNGTIYAAIVELAEERGGGRVDAPDVYAALKRAAEKTGTPPLANARDLAELLRDAPGYYGAARLAEQIADYRRRRELMYVAAGIVEAARTGSTTEVDDARLTLEHLERDRVLAGSPYGDVARALAGGVVEADPIYLLRTDGKALFYDAALNYIFGEPGKGKSWLAFLCAAEVMRDGGTVVLADFEDTLAGVVGRFRTLAVPDDVLVRRLHYVTDPAGRPLADLRRLSLEPRPDLVILDGVAASLAAAELDENSSADVNGFLDAWLIPAARAGAAVIGVDHVTKSKDQRGLWPRGSGAKRARIDGAAYFVEPGTDGLFTRSSDGSVRAILAKDRRGIIGQEGALIATLKVRHNEEADALGVLVTYLDPPASLDTLVEGGELDDPSVNLKLAEGILVVLEELIGEGPKGRRDLREELAARGLKASNEKIGAACAYLRRHGRIERLRTGHKEGFVLAPLQRTLDDETDPKDTDT
jgi:hypothetical protein